MNESLELDVHRAGIPYFPPPNKKFKMTNNKLRTQNATEAI